jgi:hypothetical protein
MRKPYTFSLDPEVVEQARTTFHIVPLSRVVELALKKAIEAGKELLL